MGDGERGVEDPEIRYVWYFGDPHEIVQTCTRHPESVPHRLKKSMQESLEEYKNSNASSVSGAPANLYLVINKRVAWVIQELPER